MAKDMTLLWASGSHACWRVMIALEEKNLQGYNQKQLYFEKGEHKSKEVMEINPRGQLPAFKCGDVPLNESCAACFHLECKYKSQGTKLIPDCEAGRAQILQRVFEVNALVEKSCKFVLTRSSDRILQSPLSEIGEKIIEDAFLRDPANVFHFSPCAFNSVVRLRKQP
uniref:Glutathione S-transferase rho n=1 Tax=Neolamprologus brichardi TaxID=32507 RepID=A0A3Q4N383_NEOBR